MSPTSSAITRLSRAANSAPLKPILKSSSSILGVRRSSDAELEVDDGTDGPQSPRKRHKVEFDLNNIEIREIGARSIEEIKSEVKKTLDRHDQGDSEDYDLLKETLSGKTVIYEEDDEDEDDDEPTPNLLAKQHQELKAYLIALSSFVPRMGRSCDGLVKKILQLQWLGRDEQLAKIYVQLIAALVSAQGARLTQVLSMIIDKFSYSRSTDWAVLDFPSISRESMQERLHYALRYLIQLFPAATTVLRHILASKYPFHDEPKRMHLAYVDNLLKLRNYGVDLRTEIMDLIVNRLVKIDVEMQMDLDDMDDRLTAMVAMALKTAQAKIGEEDLDDSDTESILSNDSEDEEYHRVKTTKENIEKMDTILDTLFQLYAPSFTDVHSEKAMEVFEELLSGFSNLVLPTFKSRHTQFLIFHFAQRSESLIDAFCGTCINIAFESQRPLVLQQAASAYLASFVARGAHVPGHIVVKIFEVLGYHLDQMRTIYEASCRGPDVARYTAFYALMQALMYIFCFRWQDLTKSVPDDVDKDDLSSYLDQDIEWETEIKDIMRRNIYSKLNPLRVCSPVIVEQFALLAHRFRFMYVYPLIESNKRVRLSQFAMGAYTNGGGLRDPSFDVNDESWQQLSSYFPFDPYQLPISKRWVDEDYLPWRHIPGLTLTEPADESQEDGLENDEDEAEVDEDTATDADDEEDE